MTFEQIRKSDKDFLTAEDISEVVGCNKFSIITQAKEDASKLGFPVNVMQTRVRIPRLAFIRWVMYGNAPLAKEEAYDLFGTLPQTQTAGAIG